MRTFLAQAMNPVECADRVRGDAAPGNEQNVRILQAAQPGGKPAAQVRKVEETATDFDDDHRDRVLKRLVPKLRLGTHARETPFRALVPAWALHENEFESWDTLQTRNGVSRRAFPYRVWEREAARRHRLRRRLTWATPTPSCRTPLVPLSLLLENGTTAHSVTDTFASRQSFPGESHQGMGARGLRNF